MSFTNNELINFREHSFVDTYQYIFTYTHVTEIFLQPNSNGCCRNWQKLQINSPTSLLSHVSPPGNNEFCMHYQVETTWVGGKVCCTECSFNSYSFGTSFAKSMAVKLMMISKQTSKRWTGVPDIEPRRPGHFAWPTILAAHFMQ